MRRGRVLVKVLLALLSVVGIGAAFLFLRQEQEAAALRQAQVAKLAAELEPINEKRKEWQEQDKEWQQKLEEGQKGKPCVLLSFENMDEGLYDTVFEMMDQYGFRATFAIKNGRIPSWEEGYITDEEFREMLDAGWEYALSVGEERSVMHAAPEDDYHFFGFLETETESELQTETETESESEFEEKSWLEQLDDCIASLEASQVKVPPTVFCTQEQYEEINPEDLARKGFDIVRVLNTQEFPAVERKGDAKIWRVDAGLYCQNKGDPESAVSTAISNNQSIAISVNEVVRISNDAYYDLSVTKFSGLLNYLKGLEERGEIYILTYSELGQFEEMQEAEYKDLKAQYVQFRKEMNEAIDQLEIEEEQTVARLKAQQPEEDTSLFGILMNMKDYAVRLFGRFTGKLSGE